MKYTRLICHPGLKYFINLMKSSFSFWQILTKILLLFWGYNSLKRWKKSFVLITKWFCQIFLPNFHKINEKMRKAWLFFHYIAITNARSDSRDILIFFIKIMKLFYKFTYLFICVFVATAAMKIFEILNNFINKTKSCISPCNCTFNLKFFKKHFPLLWSCKFSSF